MLNKALALSVKKSSGIRSLANQIHRDQRGQGMAEYGLIIALVAIAVIGTLTLLGPKIASKFKQIDDAMN